MFYEKCRHRSGLFCRKFNFQAKPCVQNNYELAIQNSSECLSITVGLNIDRVYFVAPCEQEVHINKQISTDTFSKLLDGTISFRHIHFYPDTF